MNAKTNRNLVVFALLVAASGGLGAWIDQLLDEQPEGNTLGMGLWLVLPLLTVVLLRTFAGDGWKDAGFALRLRASWPWYLTALLVFPLVTAITLLVGHGAGWVEWSGFQARSFGGVFAGLILGQIIKNIFEESVWRGYLTTKLVDKGFADWSVYVVAGLLWGVWHLPYYLVFLPEDMMHSVLPLNKGWFAAIAIVTMVAWSVLFVELYRIARSIWPCVLMHAVEDSLLNPLVIDGFIGISTGKELLVSPITGILPSLLYLAAGLTIRAIRLSRPQRG